MLSGLILHCCYYARNELDRPARFSDLVDFLSEPDSDSGQEYGSPQQQNAPSGLEKRLTFMRDYPHLGDHPHHMIASEATSMLEKEDRERASVASTAISFLTLYRDPAIAENTSRSDWTISDLMDNDLPASAYLVVKPSDAERLRPLIRLIMTQIVRKLTTTMEFEGGRSVAKYKHRLLLLLDEFTALKKLTVIEEALAYMAGYGIKAYLIVQDIQQLEAVYGKEEMVLSNCHIRVCFAPNKYATAELISKSIGQRTIVHQSAGGGSQDGGKQWQETQRDLMTPEEVMRLEGPRKDVSGNITRPGALIVIIAGMRPIYGTQVLYFRDHRLNQRSRMQAPDLRYGEIGDTQGYEPVERTGTQVVEYEEDETLNDLLLKLVDADTLPLWPTPAGTGEKIAEDATADAANVHMSDAVAEIVAKMEEAIEERAAMDPLLGCRDYAAAMQAALPPVSTSRVAFTRASPKLRPATQAATAAG